MSTPHLQPGSRLGAATLVSLLQARAGFETWRAQDGDGGAIVVKCITAGVERGARRALQRNHRRALGVRISGAPGPLLVSPDEAIPWVSRPWMDGIPLLDAIRELPDEQRIRQACQWGARLLHILANLHREGLVHGSLSPSNVWLTPDGQVALTDLGSSFRALDSVPGDAVGTLPPVSPEELAGWGQRPPTDVLAAGALLYAALAPPARDSTDHTTPWGGGARESLPGLAMRIRGLPRRISVLLQETQALDAMQRPSAAALSHALADWSGLQGPAPLPPCPSRVGQIDSYDRGRHHLRERGPRLVLVNGPAGSGRHRLADALARQAVRQGHPPMVVRADRAETGSVVIEVLRRLVGESQHVARRQRLLRDKAPVLCTLWPSLAPQPTLPEAGAEARQVIEAAVDVVRNAIDDRPMLIVMEGIEDADPLSLRFVHTLLDSEADISLIAIVDDRWQSEEVRRMHGRLAEHPAVLAVSLPDLDQLAVMGVIDLLLRELPHGNRPRPPSSASPARATEIAHEALAAWRDEAVEVPDAGATVFALVREVPSAAVLAAGFDPGRLLELGHAVPAGPGRIAAAHDGIVALGCRGLARRDRLATRLADAMESEGEPPDAIARLRLFGNQPADTRNAAIRAAIAAWEDDQPQDARRWLHVVDRFPRHRDDPGYAALRTPLARIRAEVAHSTEVDIVRSDLLRQAERRASTPDERAALRVARGLLSARIGQLDEACAHWAAGYADAAAPATSRARCAHLVIQAALNQGAVSRAREALDVLRDMAQVPRGPRGPRRWAALDAALVLLAMDRAPAALDALEHWRRSPESKDDLYAILLTGLARWLVGDLAGAQSDISNILDDHPFHADALVLHGLLALDRGDTRAALRARRRVGIPETLDTHLAILDLRLAAAQGEQAQLPQLLSVSPPTRRPDLLRLWLAAALDVLHTTRAPELRLARLAEARTASEQRASPDLLLAIAWHELEDGRLDVVTQLATTAENLAREAGDADRTLRARLLVSAASGIGPGAWTYLLNRAAQSERVQVRADALLLSCRIATREGRLEEAAKAIHALSDLAIQSPDHGLAARATRLHTALSQSRGLR